MIISWIIITIPHSTQSSQCIVTTDDKLSLMIIVLYPIECDEVCLLNIIFILIAIPEPKTSDEICCDDSNYDQSENFITVH